MINTKTRAVPFVDLHAQHAEVRADIDAVIHEIIDHSSFIGGHHVAAFEEQLAAYLGVEQVVGVASGTDALWLSLVSVGVGPDDAVLTVPNTFIATVEAITRTGAHPIFIDVDPETATLDIQALRAFLQKQCVRQDDGRTVHLQSGRNIVAVVPVHLYGLPAEMAPLNQLAKQYDLVIIEDACQAHGAKYHHDGTWARVGSFGLAAAFSFYPGKNLGAMGDGGAVATNEPELAERIRQLRDHGQSEKYMHVTPAGWNSRLDALQAAVLSVKLDKLDEWNDRRREAAALYREALQNLPLDLPAEPDYAHSVYHLFVVQAPDRDFLRQALNARAVQTGLHYPIPLHRQPAYQYLGIPAGSFPNAERLARGLLSLPMHPALTADQVEYVASCCRDILRAH